MRTATQIALYAISFAVLLVLGNVLDIAFYQASHHSKQIRGIMPLPALSEFFMTNHHLPAHLTLLPWFAMVAAPLRKSARDRSFWDAQAFTFRYVAFLSAEIALFIVLLLALAFPFLPYVAAIEPPRQHTAELVVRVFFWLSATCVVLGVVRRIREWLNVSSP